MKKISTTIGSINSLDPTLRAEADIITDRLASKAQITFIKDLPPDAPQDQKEKAVTEADCFLCVTLSNDVEEWIKPLLGHPKMVQTLSAGADQINFNLVPHDTNLHINAGGWASTMAEHALAMALCSVRKLIPQRENLKKGLFQKEGYNLRSLQGMQILIIGYGGIGKACAKIFAPFHTKITAVNRTQPIDPILQQAHTMEALDQLLKEADITIIAVPLTNHTRNLIDSSKLSLMKENAILINLARAPIINQDDLYDHLKTHPHFDAALDVWWDENQNFHQKHPFLDLTNLIPSSHNSGLSENAYAEALELAIDNIELFLQNKEPKGKLNINEYIRQE